MTQFVRNILRVYRKATEQELREGKAWYETALDECDTMSRRYGVPVHIVVGVVAALSPSNRWERNLKDADSMINAYVSGQYMDEVSVATYGAMKAKAWDILSRSPDEDEVVSILNGPKIVDFYRCIMGEDTCVIDGHAWCIAHNERRSMQEVPSIGKAARKELQDAYVRAGKRVGIPAYEVQAITWVAWRRMHNV